MTLEERQETLEQRRANNQPWHRIPCIDSGDKHYLITATCFNHATHIGHSADRMSDFTNRLLAIEALRGLVAWTVLPNHYHLLCRSTDIKKCRKELGQLHGLISFTWNKKDQQKGRKVWFGAVETAIKSDRHYWATINYIHNNPVKHGCASKQSDWPWSSFSKWQDGLGREALVELWNEFTIEKYGESWDTDNLSTFRHLVSEFMDGRK